VADPIAELHWELQQARERVRKLERGQDFLLERIADLERRMDALPFIPREDGHDC